MKRRLLVLFVIFAAALALALWLGSFLLREPGYVLIVRGRTELETSLAFLVLVLLAGAFALVLLTVLAGPLWQLLTPASWSHWRRRRAGSLRLQNGLLALAAGHWREAEEQLRAAANQTDWPLPALLAAAVAARQRGDGDGERYWLRNASDFPRGRLPAALLAARFALTDNNPTRARELLDAERPRHGDSPVLLQLLAEAYSREGDWAAVCELIPTLRRLSLDANLDLRERRAWHARMRQAATQPGFTDAAQRRESLHRLWKKMPAELRHEPQLRAQYAGYLAQLEDGAGALKIVTGELDKRWDDGLPAVLEAINDVPPEQLLTRLERWLQERPGNQVLLLTAGRVALKAKLWGKARSFFETAAQSGSGTAMAELARLYDALGEEARAREMLRRQLGAQRQQLPSLPLPERGRTSDV